MPGETDRLIRGAPSGYNAIFTDDPVVCDHESLNFQEIIQHCLDIGDDWCPLTADQLHQVKIMCASGDDGVCGFYSYLIHMHQGI